MLSNLSTWAVLLMGFLGLTSTSPVPSNDKLPPRLSKSLEMMRYLNTSADPCDDFYKFACGNYAQYHPASEHRPGTHILAYAREELLRKISEILTQEYDMDLEDYEDSEIKKNVKHFYNSCLNAQTALSANYPHMLQEIIKEFGQMPLLELGKWQEKDFDWLTIVGKISHKYNINIILSYFVYVDMFTNVRNRLHLGHPNFGLESTTLYFDEEHENVRQTYKDSIAATLVNGLDVQTDLAEQTTKEIFDFEVSLVKGLLDFSPGEKHDFAHRLTNTSTLDVMYSPFDMNTKKLLELWLGHTTNNSDLEIMEIHPYYQTNLIQVLRSTPKKVLANYIFYKLISHFPLPDPNMCEALTIQHYSKFLSHLVYHESHMEPAAQYVNAMFADLKATFQHALESSKYSWIDPATRKFAVAKLKSMTLVIGSHDDIQMSQEYGALKMDHLNYIENLKKLYEQNALKSRAMLIDPPKYHDDDIGFGYSPAYSLPDNSVRFPVSNLLPKYIFSTFYPQSINFGSLGFLLAHEIIHGFDDEGRKVDMQGLLNDWWDEESAKTYTDLTECFMDQYHEYTYEGYQLPRRTLQSENIADNGGVRLAYATYREWYEKALSSGLDKNLETLPCMERSFTNEQLFFINMAQAWCSDILPESRIAIMASDEHMPDSIRVKGALSNFEEFSKVFQCPKGSGMNPSRKCQIF